MSSTCGGKITDNLGPAAIFTIVPWLLIFGVMIGVLMVYPGFKSVFSDVVGYFYISSSANEIITKLLVNKDVNDTLKEQPNTGQETVEPSAPPFEKVNDTVITEQPYSDQEIAEPSASLSFEDSTPSQKEPKGGKRRKQKGGAPSTEQVQDAADLIVKICGNVSILINQIVPENFKSYWEILRPLIKPKYTENPSEQNRAEFNQIQLDLFDNVVTRDNIGEAMWFLYTGILVTSLVQLKIATRGCVKSSAQMEADYKKFLAKEADIKAKKELSEKAEYTIT